MDDYSKGDILNALLSLDLKKRTRVLVDQRSYLIGILYYRFMMTEHQIADRINIKRDKVNYNKKLAVQFCNDKLYIKNVYVYAQMYPFDFSVIETVSVTQRAKRIELDMDKKFYNKLKAAGAILGHKDVRVTIKLFLEKSLKLWEE
tara:strand:+ start:4132 stop:4569 length:438 start_codon:yes stop_codon:yes gene_type:complete